MKTLSVFVDESGTINVNAKHIPYYIISIVLHNQDNDISQEITKLNNELLVYGLNSNLVHTEPLIRNEDIYNGMHYKDRRGILSKFNFFIKHINIKYKSFIYEKKRFSNDYKLDSAIAKDISDFFDRNSIFFKSFDKIILYYDYGQIELSKILNHMMALHFVNYEIKKILPQNYKLFQVADFACSIELIAKKIESKKLTKSETLIFNSKNSFKKDFLKELRKKLFE